jgi:hypothetical protein
MPKLRLFSLIGVMDTTKLHHYFQRTGISHRVSCPYTSQLNGIVEHKHRHIVETGLVLRAYSSLLGFDANNKKIISCATLNFGKIYLLVML